MFNLISKLIKSEDFAQTRHVLAFTNDTSGMNYFNPADIIIGELNIEGITIKVPKKSVQKGHNLTLYFFADMLTKKRSDQLKKGNTRGSFAVIGQISQLSDDEFGTYASIHFTQFDKYKWKKIVAQYEAAQIKINSLSADGNEENLDD